VLIAALLSITYPSGSLTSSSSGLFALATVFLLSFWRRISWRVGWYGNLYRTWHLPLFMVASGARAGVQGSLHTSYSFLLFQMGYIRCVHHGMSQVLALAFADPTAQDGSGDLRRRILRHPGVLGAANHVS
jgi:hypothetical protein